MVMNLMVSILVHTSPLKHKRIYKRRPFGTNPRNKGDFRTFCWMIEILDWMDVKWREKKSHHHRKIQIHQNPTSHDHKNGTCMLCPRSYKKEYLRMASGGSVSWEKVKRPHFQKTSGTVSQTIHVWYLYLHLP